METNLAKARLLNTYCSLMKSLVLMLATLLVSCTLASGRSMKFALTSDIHNLGRLAEMYHDAEGASPETWTEFESRFGPTEKICSVLNPRDRFAFVPKPVLLPAYPAEDRIILISREPFRPPTERQIPIINTWYKTVGDSVYVAAVKRGDGVFIRKIAPEEAARVFQDAGAELPGPSGLGLYPHEKTHLFRTIALWVGSLAVCALGISSIARRRKRSSESGPEE